MRQPMAHRTPPSQARSSIRDDPRPVRRPVGRSVRQRYERPPRGRRRFIGPTLLVLGALVLLASSFLRAPSASAGPTGQIAGRTAAPLEDASLDPGASPAAQGVAPVVGSTPPPCRQDDILAPNQAPEDWASTILDTAYRMAEDAAPPDLVRVTDAGVEGRGRIRAIILDDLRALGAAARSDGATLFVASAYRSYQQQVASYASYAAAYGDEEARRTVARPGHSEHQLGTTVDFEGDLEWLGEHAPRFGFVMSYDAAASPDRTCYRHEAWHFRYVGRERAAAVMASGLSLREWLWANQP